MPTPKPNLPNQVPQPPRKARILPLPRPALAALDSARKCPIEQLESHLTTLLPHLSNAETLDYIIKRLHNGLTTTTARRNYTILLCAITRHTKATKKLLTTPYPQYTTPREDALARLALIAALVRAGVKVISMVAMLRDIACAESGRWRMGDACVTLLKHLIDKSDHSLLREWCRERRLFGDGLHLGCILLRQGILSDKAFCKIYHGPADVRKALLDSCDTGFSMLGRDNINVPPVWPEALSSSHQLLGLSVWPVLQIPSSGVEKKLLLISLLPTVARYVTPESFDKVFTPYVGKVAKSLCEMREHRGIRIRLERVTESSKRAVKKVIENIGGEVWKQLSKITRELEEADQLCTRFIVWSVRHGIVHRLFPKLDILSDIEERLSKKLFTATVREFAKAGEAGVRGSLVRFLFSLAAKHGFVDDAVKIVALYAGFEGGEGDFKLDQFISADGDAFAGCLPVPSPPLSQVDAGVAFRRLVEFCTDQQVAFSCLKVLRKGLELGLKPRCARRIEADEGLKEAVFRVVDYFSRSVESADKPLAQSLRIVTEFVAIQYLAPVEDLEVGQGSVREFQRLLNSLDECVLAVFDSDEKDDQEGPMPVERVAHLITDLCGHESASFRQISVKAVEALGTRLDDAVTAVLFDALESYVSGSGVPGREDIGDDSEGDEGSEEDGADGDGGEEDEGEDEADDQSEDDEEDNEQKGDKKSNDDLGLEETAPVANREEGEDNSEDSSEPEVDKTENDVMGEAQSEDEDDSVPDVDMDPDDEDPEVLAQFDQRLAMHMKLINKEKNTAKQRKLRAGFRFTQASRVLSIIESVAKILRMHIETAKEIGQRTHIVFLDLHVRLYDFALSDGSENGRFLPQVTGIAAKQMMLPCSFFVGKIADSETVVEIAKRFLLSIQHCSAERKPSEEETRIISRSAGCLVGTAATLTKDNYRQFLPIYEELVRQTLQATGHLVNPGMLNSFFRRAPAEAAKLFPIVEDVLGGDNITKNRRTTASEIIAQLAEAVRQGSEADDTDLNKFWDGLEKFLKNSIDTENVKKWRPLMIANFAQAASHGIKARRFKDHEGLSAAMSEMVKAAAVNRQERLKLLKLLRTPGDGHATKRRLPADGDEPESEEKQVDAEGNVEVKKTTRPRKRSKRAK